jgi:hypothetical protein
MTSAFSRQVLIVGDRLTVVSGRDNAFNGQAPERQRVDQIANDVYGPKTLESYLNRAAFAQPEPGTFGNHERNSLEGPRFWKIDLAVTRLVPIASAHTLEVRVEVFNLLNNFNWGRGAQETYVDFGAAAFGADPASGR